MNNSKPSITALATKPYLHQYMVFQKNLNTLLKSAIIIHQQQQGVTKKQHD